MYEYRGTVLRAVDGDTVDVEIDLGFDLRIRQRVRLGRINAPETRGATKAAGLRAKAFVERQCPPGTVVTLITIKPREKYGRYLAEILLPGVGAPRRLSDLLVEAGMAALATY